MNTPEEQNKQPTPKVVTIFLDFDGVLHPVGATSDRLFEKAGELAEMLQELRHTEVVISSSWAAYHSLQQIRDLLEGWPALHIRIVGITEQRIRGQIERSDFPERETQCLDWLISNNRSLYRWVAIDDNALNFATRERLVKTCGFVGLTQVDLEKLRRLVAKTGEGWN